MRSLFWGLAALALGCSRSAEPAGSGLSVGDGVTTTEATAASSTGTDAGTTAAATSIASTSGSDATTWSPPKDDVGAPDLGGGGPACNGKIDIVFVIPNAGDEYFDAAMPASLPAFAETMTTTLADFDLHVMVLDSSGTWGAPPYCPKSKCPADGSCPALEDPSFPCWALHDEDALTACDNTPGAGVTFPAGQWASNVRCPLPEGRRFLTSADPDFVENFLCLGTLGGKGESSRGMECLMRAVSPELNFGCNAGFLRDDALLLLFVIAIDDYSDYSPAVWANAVLEAKGGDQDLIATVAVAPDGALEEPLCPDAEIGAPNDIYKFAMLYEHHVLGSYCASSYASYFHQGAVLATQWCEVGPQE